MLVVIGSYVSFHQNNPILAVDSFDLDLNKDTLLLGRNNEDIFQYTVHNKTLTNIVLNIGWSKSDRLQNHGINWISKDSKKRLIYMDKQGALKLLVNDSYKEEKIEKVMEVFNLKSISKLSPCEKYVMILDKSNLEYGLRIVNLDTLEI
jgi:hypothetical protein